MLLKGTIWDVNCGKVWFIEQLKTVKKVSCSCREFYNPYISAEGLWVLD